MFGTYAMISNYVAQDSRDGIPKLKDESNEDIVRRYKKDPNDFDLCRLYVKNFSILYNISRKFSNINMEDKGSNSLECCQRALDSYNFGSSLFLSWLTLCWKRQLITISQRNERTKNVSQCEPFIDESEMDFDNGSVSSEYKMLKQLEFDTKDCYSKIDFSLSFKTLLDIGIWKDDEKEVLIGAYCGFTDNEISSLLGVSNAQIYWARKRVRDVLTSNKELYNMIF